MKKMDNNIIPLDRVKNFTISVNEPTVEIFMEEFVKNAFKQKSLKFKSTYKIFYTYMFKTREYQISYFESSSKNEYLELECFKPEAHKTQLFVCKDLFALYCGDQLYYYQKLADSFDIEEIKNYVHKRLNINTFSVNIFNNKPSKKRIELLFLKKISYKNCIAFALYGVLLCASILYLFQMSLKKNAINQVELLEYKTIYKQLNKRFLFNEKVFEYYNKLNTEIALNGLLLLSFEFKSEKINIVLASANKKDLYRFLNTQMFKFQNSSLDFQESRGQYVLHTEIEVV